jgi:hypothetical protein
MVPVLHSGRFEMPYDRFCELKILTMVSIWEVYRFPNLPKEHIGKSVAPLTVTSAGVLHQRKGDVGESIALKYEM